MEKDKIVEEVKCPNCKKIIQCVETRKGCVKRKMIRLKGKFRGYSYKVIKGVYKWRIK